jgi:hypothetical protein
LLVSLLTPSCVDERQQTHETVYRLIECAAADHDRGRAMSTLARRLEQVANIVRDGALLGELAESFEVLKLNSALSQRLGRAIALEKARCCEIRCLLVNCF